LSSPEEGEERDDIAYISSNIENGFNKQMLFNFGLLLIAMNGPFISSSEETYEENILSQNDKNQSSFL